MENELRELGNRLMRLIAEDKTEPRLDGLSNVDVLALIYVTGTAGEALASVADEIEECADNGTWWGKE